MPDLITTFGPIRLPTFTLALLLAALASVAWAGWRLRRAERLGVLADAGLGALAGAAVLGRFGHVLLQEAYFRVHPEEIFRLGSGGLNWHGALVGGLLGLALVGRWRGARVARLIDTLTPALPLLALAGWVGCAAAGCGYGAEVDTLARYPAPLVWEARDVYGLVAPRYNTPLFGMLLAGAALLLAFVLLALRPLVGLRFWLVAALLAAGMFAIGFIRADSVPLVGGLRLDQWFDTALLAGCLGIVAAELAARRRQLPASPLPAAN